jgi:hypothetical protein
MPVYGILGDPDWVLQLWDEPLLPGVVGVVVGKGEHLGAASPQQQLQRKATQLAHFSTTPQSAVGGFLLQALVQQQLLSRLGIG